MFILLLNFSSSYLSDSLDTFVIIPHKHCGPLVLHVVPHFLVCWDLGVSEERHGTATTEGSVGNLLLSGQILGVLDGRDHLVNGEEGGEVGGVGGDDDQGEKPPNGSDYSRAGGFGVETRSLSEESSRYEPETVVDAELVLHHVVIHHTGVGVVPLVRRKPGHDEQSEGDENVGGQNIQPDLHCQGVHEAEQSGGFPTRNLEQDGDPEVHERFGEVNNTLPGKVYRHRPHCNICLVIHQLLG